MRKRTQQPNYLPTRNRTRRGFAFPFMLLLLLVLFTFLVSAQGTVIGSAKMVKRSAVRADQASAVTAALGYVAGLGPAAIAGSGQAPIAVPGEFGEAINCTAGALAASDSFYARLPGVSFREGDVLMRIVLTQSGSEEAQEFLLNTAGSRDGIIGL